MRTRTIIAIVTAFTALTACTASSHPTTAASSTTAMPSTSAAPNNGASPACRSKVFDLYLENIAGAPVPSERPAECAGLTDQQWSEVLDEQGKKLLEVGGAIASTAPAAEPATSEAVFKVWGSAPSKLSITYGSDSENLDGKGLPMTRTLKVKNDALYLHITAQLSGRRRHPLLGHLRRADEGRARTRRIQHLLRPDQPPVETPLARRPPEPVGPA